MPSRRQTPSGPTRRGFIRAAVFAAAGLPLVGCGNQVARKRFPGSLADFTEIKDLPLRTFRIGPATGRALVVLHELPGLTPDDMALARAFGQRGFSVYAPLLFGQPEQDSVRKGYGQACRSKLFECSELAGRSRILDTLDLLCDQIAQRSGHPIGVVGMCLTGVLPLALLPHGVNAAVLCQPTLPFRVPPGRPTGDQKTDLGLGPRDLAVARESKVPFIVLRYTGDGRCPPERLQELRRCFGERVASIELEGDHHSSLAGDFHDHAFDDVVDYVAVRLGVQTGPRAMRRAKLRPEDSQPCQIGADGMWHAS